MVGRTVEAEPAAPTAHRCRCGHYPTTHMRVVPASGNASGSFRLEASGPCQACGEPVCRRFAP
ncbi:MAG TPA: hypothetical protein VN864_08895 [Thermoplasmata archaeon]|nr:hypothetical protein [Thermoplasmata archaeon]